MRAGGVGQRGGDPALGRLSRRREDAPRIDDADVAVPLDGGQLQRLAHTRLPRDNIAQRDGIPVAILRRGRHLEALAGGQQRRVRRDDQRVRQARLDGDGHGGGDGAHVRGDVRDGGRDRRDVGVIARDRAHVRRPRRGDGAALAEARVPRHGEVARQRDRGAHAHLGLFGLHRSAGRDAGRLPPRQRERRIAQKCVRAGHVGAANGRAPDLGERAQVEDAALEGGVVHRAGQILLLRRVAQPRRAERRDGARLRHDGSGPLADGAHVRGVLGRVLRREHPVAVPAIQRDEEGQPHLRGDLSHLRVEQQLLVAPAMDRAVAGVGEQRRALVPGRRQRVRGRDAGREVGPVGIGAVLLDVDFLRGHLLRDIGAQAFEDVGERFRHGFAVIGDHQRAIHPRRRRLLLVGQHFGHVAGDLRLGLSGQPPHGDLREAISVHVAVEAIDGHLALRRIIEGQIRRDVRGRGRAVEGRMVALEVEVAIADQEEVARRGRGPLLHGVRDEGLDRARVHHAVVEDRVDVLDGGGAHAQSLRAPVLDQGRERS